MNFALTVLMKIERQSGWESGTFTVHGVVVSAEIQRDGRYEASMGSYRVPDDPAIIAATASRLISDSLAHERWREAS